MTEFSKSPFVLIAPFFFLGTAMVVMKAIIPDTTPLFLAGFRLVPAGLLVILLAAVLKIPQPQGWKAWSWIALFALIDGAMFQGFLTTGLINTGAGLGAVLIDAQPLLVAILAWWLFGEKIGLWGWLGLFIGIFGIYLCGLPEEWHLSTLQGKALPLEAIELSLESLLQKGELLMLLAALSMSFGTVIIRYVSRHVDPIMATGWHMLLGGIPLFALSGLWENSQWQNLSLQGWLGMGYATFFGTAITYGLFFFLAANGNLTSISALIFLTPIFALLFSFLFLGEQLNTFDWIGVVLTLISVYLVNQRQTIAERVERLLNKSPVLEESKPEA